MNHVRVYSFDDSADADAAARALRGSGMRCEVIAVPAGRGGAAAIEGAIARSTFRTALAVATTLGVATAVGAWLAGPPGLSLAMGATIALTAGLFIGGFVGFLGAWSRLGPASALAVATAPVAPSSLVVARAASCAEPPVRLAPTAAVSCCSPTSPARR